MNRKDSIIGLLIGVLIGTSVAYAAQLNMTFQGTITIPENIDISVTGVTESSGVYYFSDMIFSTKEVTRGFSLKNDGSTDISITWTMQANGDFTFNIADSTTRQAWNQGLPLVVPRGDTQDFTMTVTDNGNEPGGYGFTLSIGAD